WRGSSSMWSRTACASRPWWRSTLGPTSTSTVCAMSPNARPWALY
ncbi:Threonine dehydratase biosynthetic (EC 4.3.1.19), partial [Pseudomonas sp. FEN]